MVDMTDVESGLAYTLNVLKPNTKQGFLLNISTSNIGIGDLVNATQRRLDELKGALTDLKMKDHKMAQDQFQDVLMSMALKFQSDSLSSPELLKRFSDDIKEKLNDAQKSALAAKNSGLKPAKTLDCVKYIIATELLGVINEATRKRNMSKEDAEWFALKATEAWIKCNKYLQEINDLKEIAGFIASKTKIDGSIFSVPSIGDAKMQDLSLELLWLNIELSKFFKTLKFSDSDQAVVATSSSTAAPSKAILLVGRPPSEIALRFVLLEKGAVNEDFLNVAFEFLKLGDIGAELAQLSESMAEASPDMLCAIVNICVERFNQTGEELFAKTIITILTKLKTEKVNEEVVKLLNERQYLELIEAGGLKDNLAGLKGSQVRASSCRNDKESAENAFTEGGKWVCETVCEDGVCDEFIEVDLPSPQKANMIAIKADRCVTAPTKFRVLAKVAVEDEKKKKADDEWECLLEAQDVKWASQSWMFWALKEVKTVRAIRIEITAIENYRIPVTVAQIRLY